jgi:CBS domain-containing protein
LPALDWQSDLHGSDLKDLLLGFRGPVAAYVEKFAHSRAVGGLYPTVVQRSDTLAHVLKKLADTHLHQLFVVDGEAVVAVCSLGDVIRTLNDAL